MVPTKENRITKALVAAAVACFMAATLCLAACSPQSTGSQADQSKKIQVNVIVDTSAASGGEVKTVSAQVKEGANLLDALEASGISFSTSSGPYGRYVNNIDGFAEGQQGAASGWTFTVNDQMLMEAPDTIKLNEGDTVRWTYMVGDTFPEGL